MANKKGIVEILPKSPNISTLPVDATMSAFQMLIKTHHEYKSIAAQEKTKRMAINSWETTRLAELANQKDLLKAHFEQTFQERKEMIDGFFQVLDKGLDNNNPEAINAALSGLVNIVQTSPLREVDKLMSALKDSNTKTIEF